MKWIHYPGQKTCTDACTGVCECLNPQEDKKTFERCPRKALKEGLMVTPEIRIENLGTLERTTLKAKRIMDKRK